MIVYNITIKIYPGIEEEWIHWQKEENIPGVMATGQFVDYKFYRLLEQDESDGITYILQYYSSSLDHYTTYITQFSPAIHQKAFDKWSDKFISFRTVMQAVD